MEGLIKNSTTSKDGSLSGFVAGLQEILAASGCSFRLHDMGTTVEGPAPISKVVNTWM